MSSRLFSRRLAAMSIAAACVVLPLAAASVSIRAQSVIPATQPAKVRIGVYDGRSVALAHGRSTKVSEAQAKLAGEGRAAKAAGDTKRFEEIEAQMKMQQFTAHAQVFSNSPPTEAVEAIKPALERIAKEMRLAAIAERVDFQGAEVEAVDVTMELVKEFAPTPDTLKTVEALRKAKPVNLYDATHHDD